MMNNVQDICERNREGMNCIILANVREFEVIFENFGENNKFV